MKKIILAASAALILAASAAPSFALSPNGTGTNVCFQGASAPSSCK